MVLFTWIANFIGLNKKPAEPVTRCGRKCKDAANCAEQWGDECCAVIDPPINLYKVMADEVRKAEAELATNHQPPTTFTCPECQDKNTPATCACMWP